jgi:hypothetical protein
MSPTVDEVYFQAKFLREKGRGAEKAVLVLPAEEAKKRVANDGPKPKTRLIKEMHTKEAYSDWNSEFDRYVSNAGDPNIAYSIMLRLLQQLADTDIRKLAEEP